MKQAYQLRISQRVKHARIVVKLNGVVEVVLPVGASKKEADRLVGKQQAWIERALMRVQPAMQPEILPDSILLPAIDASYAVVYQEKNQRKAWQLDDDTLHLSETTNPQEVLRDWLKACAKQYLPAMLEDVAQDMGVDYQKVTVRLQKTRWGSCSTAKNISLNARLLLLPMPIVRYVLVHELAHLKHMNHSPLFWHYVSEFEPNYNHLRRELRIKSMQLPVWSSAS